MRRTVHILITLASILAALLAVQVFMGSSRYRTSQLKGLYDSYSHRPGIRAALICNYYVADTVMVDMMMLSATDDSAWVMLQHDFDIPPIPDEFRQLFEKNESFGYKLFQIDSTMSPEVCVYSRKEYKVCVFHVNSDAESKSILHEKLIDISNKKIES